MLVFWKRGVFVECSKSVKKQIYVTLTEQDHERLSRLARETGRTRPGYPRWLLYRHFRELDRGAPD